MLKDFFKKNEEGKEKKKQIENIIIFIIILIVTVLIINSMWSTDNKESKNNTQDKSKILAESNPENTIKEENIETELEEILESIKGVGKVKVLIKYSESSTVVAMYNETKSESTTKESDKDGSSRDVKETENKKEVIYSEEDGQNKPITEKVVMPVIEGAIITAQGANDVNVKSSIVSAVEAVTGLAVHKIQVFEMRFKIERGGK